jgi:hypothetical protein
MDQSAESIPMKAPTTRRRPDARAWISLRHYRIVKPHGRGPRPDRPGPSPRRRHGQSPTATPHGGLFDSKNASQSAQTNIEEFTEIQARPLGSARSPAAFLRAVCSIAPFLKLTPNFDQQSLKGFTLRPFFVRFASLREPFCVLPRSCEGTKAVPAKSAKVGRKKPLRIDPVPLGSGCPISFS